MPLVAGLIMIGLFGVLEWAKAQGLPLGDQLPFNSWVVNWGVMLVPLSLVLRSLYLTFKPEAKPTTARAEHRETGFTRLYLKYNKAFGGLLIAFAVALPFMPFADRRLVDVATLVLTYMMLGWASTSWSASPACSTSAMSPSTRSVPTATPCSLSISG